MSTSIAKQGSTIYGNVAAISPGPPFPAAKACKIEDLFAAMRGLIAGVFIFAAQGDLRGGTGTVSLQLSVGRGVADYRCRAKPYVPINSMRG